MKIIARSNFDKETVSDVLIAENVSELNTILISKLLNAHFPENYTYTYFGVKDDYKLYSFEP